MRLREALRRTRRAFVVVLDQEPGEALEFVAELPELALVHGMAGAQSAQFFLTGRLVLFRDEASGGPVVGPPGEVELTREMLLLALANLLGIGLGAGEVLLESLTVGLDGAGFGFQSAPLALSQSVECLGGAGGVRRGVDEFVPRLLECDRLGGQVALCLVLLGLPALVLRQALEVELAGLLAP